MDNEEKELKYVHEQIVKPPLIKRVFKRYGFVFVFTCLAIGVIATVFLYAKKGDDKDGTTPDTTYFRLPEEKEAPTVTDNVGNKIDKSRQLSAEELKSVADLAKFSAVTVTAYNTDIKTVGMEPTSIATGVVIKKGVNIIIMTDCKSVQGAARVEVTFNDGNSYEAKYKIGDGVCDVSILTIEAANLLDGTNARIREAKLGNSATVKNGNQVIYIGNPINTSQYIDYGMVSSEDYKIVVDRQMKVFHTNINLPGMANGFVFDVDGELVGVVADITSVSTNVLSTVGISDLKGVIEKLSNGMYMSYMGIMGREITEDIKKNYDKDMPNGVYVTETVMDSPAYETGIRSGDIITKVGNIDVYKMSDISDVLEELSSGDTLTVTIQRKESDGYAGYTMSVELKTRK